MLGRPFWDLHFPGLAAAACAALAAQFLADHYGAPAMLMAILIGMALHFLGEETRAAPGIDLASRALLRLGVALLGLRISAELVLGLGWPALALILGAVAATIGFGLALARGLGQPGRFGLLTGGAVAICGASAAMAIAAILPAGRREDAERDLAFTVVGVTVLSTLAMILYPVLVQRLGLDARAAGLFLGATIHDVAQVVGAGFSLDQVTGELSTLVKLIRVCALAPVVVLAALVLRRAAEAAPAGPRPPLVPGFVLAFLGLAALNSAGLVPAVVSDAAAGISRWALLTAIAAVGMKTSLPRLMQVGRPALVLLGAETLFLALLVLGGVMLL